MAPFFTRGICRAEAQVRDCLLQLGFPRIFDRIGEVKSFVPKYVLARTPHEIGVWECGVEVPTLRNNQKTHCTVSSVGLYVCAQDRSCVYICPHPLRGNCNSITIHPALGKIPESDGIVDRVTLDTPRFSSAFFFVITQGSEDGECMRYPQYGVPHFYSGLGWILEGDSGHHKLKY